MTPASVLEARGYDPFCAISVLGTIHALADASHSKDMSDLVTAGKWKGELLFTLGKIAAPRYANFIGRYRDDPAVDVRAGAAAGLGLIDNDAVTVPVLIHMLARNDRPDEFMVKWEAMRSLTALAKRKPSDALRRRLGELLREPGGMTLVLTARVLAAMADARGVEKLRELTTHTDRRVRREAVLALGELADAGSRAAVTRRLEDDAVSVRAAAVYALARIGGAAVAPVLRKAVEDTLALERTLEARHPRGNRPELLTEQYGVGEFDVRETLQEALGLGR